MDPWAISGWYISIHTQKGNTYPGFVNIRCQRHPMDIKCTAYSTGECMESIGSYWLCLLMVLVWIGLDQRIPNSIGRCLRPIGIHRYLLQQSPLARLKPVALGNVSSSECIVVKCTAPQSVRYKTPLTESEGFPVHLRWKSFLLLSSFLQSVLLEPQIPSIILGLLQRRQIYGVLVLDSTRMFQF